MFCGGGDGGTPPELCSAAGEVAGVGVLGATGLGLGRGLAEGGVRCVRNALEATGRWLGARTGFLDGEGGSAATEFAGTRCLGA